MDAEKVLFGLRCVIFGMLVDSILSIFAFYLFSINILLKENMVNNLSVYCIDKNNKLHYHSV